MDVFLDILNLKQNLPISALGFFLWYVISTFKVGTKENFIALDNKIEKLDAKIDRVAASLNNDIKAVEDKLSTEIKIVARDLNDLDKAFIRFESKQNEKKIS